MRFGKSHLEVGFTLRCLQRLSLPYLATQLCHWRDNWCTIGLSTADGEDRTEVDLTDIAKQADLSKLEPAKRPLFNSTLQLSGIYFMQELRRPVKKEERKNMRELEEELIANLLKSDFLIAMDKDPEDPHKVNIPFLKNKEGDVLQPAFSDIMEFEKFAKGKKLRAARVPFAKLPDVLIPQAKAMVVNPMGINLILDKEQLNKILKR